MFRRPSVKAILNQFVKAKLSTDSTAYKAENLELLEKRFKSAALPTYIILSHEDQEITRFLGYTADEDKFKNFLKKGLPQPK
ncbi:MAG: hypothetical protein AABZ60_04755 [Planctomycetota bacterium]